MLCTGGQAWETVLLLLTWVSDVFVVTFYSSGVMFLASLWWVEVGHWCLQRFAIEFSANLLLLSLWVTPSKLRCEAS